MNTADSERIAASLEMAGYRETAVVEEADIIVINSCVVRQAAEDSVYGFGKRAIVLKEKSPDLKIIVTGCLVGTLEERPQRIALDKLRKKISWVDEFWPIGKIGFDMKPKRMEERSALIPISSGCNNFCTYCVVPYTRGRERSRAFREIIEETKKVAENGATEITLLGQNVNSYGKDLKPGHTFSELLIELHAIDGITRIKFLTAHPKDMSDELIDTIASLPKIDRYLHFPIQAGDDEILRRMNRGYTVADYVTLVGKIRARIPRVEIGTDIIVGFPGETEEQFNHTKEVMEKVRFNNAFIAMYSPRKGSAAYALTDDVPRKEKQRRHHLLLETLHSFKS